MEKSRDLLAARLKAGECDAASELVDIYYERIYLFMRRLGCSRQVSEDLTQETFLRAWQHISQLKDSLALDSWLYHIAANVSRLYWRRGGSEKAADIEGIGSPNGGESDAADIEEINRLKNAVDRLSIKLRQAIVLHYLQQLTIAEAADAVGVRQGTFKSRLNRALKILRRQVAPEK